MPHPVELELTPERWGEAFACALQKDYSVIDEIARLVRFTFPDGAPCVSVATKAPAPELTPGWISVEERLPEPGVLVLIFVPADDYSAGGIDTDVRNENGDWYESEELATHWMPLPAAPVSRVPVVGIGGETAEPAEPSVHEAEMVSPPSGAAPSNTAGAVAPPLRGEAVKFSRAWAMPSADTFDVRPIGDLVRRHLRGVSVDPFARNKGWATHTNDLNPATSAAHHLDAADFLRLMADEGVAADVVIFDPPYSPRQITECYSAIGRIAGQQDTQSARLYAECRREIRKLCRKGSVVLSFGWNSVGMGKGFEIEEVLLVCHGGAHNDTICMVERMVESQDSLLAETSAESASGV